MDEDIWYIFKGDELLLYSASRPRLPHSSEVAPLASSSVRSGKLSMGCREAFWAEVPSDLSIPSKMVPMGLREVGALLGEETFAEAGRAFQIMNWYRRAFFCVSCGAPLRDSSDDHARECTSCGSIFYPPISPAVIVAVERDGKILLARNVRFPPGRYSVIAGFVEPGESLEETVRREVREEVSLEIRDLQYFGSQSWPFPHSLMVGFTAHWASGEIQVDGKEIEDAGWFAPDEMPDLPQGVSISRKLIEHFRSAHAPHEG
ncbi:MAG TPA: NAD(+) diphosphatase [Thermosynergistes sp.]|nr:NAD(+) diphosphatase [Thermosynergistes sp.]